MKAATAMTIRHKPSNVKMSFIMFLWVYGGGCPYLTNNEIISVSITIMAIMPPIV